MRGDQRDYRRLALYSSLILALPTTLLGAVYLGYLADRHMGTSPWLTLAGFLIGTAGAFWELFRIIGRDRD